MSSPEPRRRMPWKGLVVGVLLLAGGAWLFQARVVPATGQLVVSVSPSLDGVVTLDGANAGRPDQALTATVGDHLVGLQAPHWSTDPVHVAISTSRTARITLAPTPEPAMLLVQARPPQAVLSLNGRKIGPSPARLSLAPGTWQLSAEAPGFRSATQSVTLTPGEQRTADIRLDPALDTRTRVMAQAGAWSLPVPLAPGDSFSFVFKGRARARIGGQVILLDEASINLGTINARSLQLKSAMDHALPIEILIHHASAP